jgi:hypothetical protein
MLDVKCRACEALHWINGRIHSVVLRSVEMCRNLSKLSSTTLLHLHDSPIENVAVRLQHTQIQVWFRDLEYGNGVRYNRDSKINRAILSRLIGMMYCVNPFVPLYTMVREQLQALLPWRAPTFCRHVIDVKFVIGNGGWCAPPNCSEACLCTVYIPVSLLDTPLRLDSGDVGVNLYLKCRYCRLTGCMAHSVAPGSNVLNGLQSIYRITGNMCIHFLKGRV